MQTFLTHGTDFEASASALDTKRLGKQRVECLQILQALKKGDAARGWKNHPAVKMWRHREAALVQYQAAVIKQWEVRGFKDNCWTRTAELANSMGWTDVVYPDWIYAEELRITHRGRLYVKDPVQYAQWEEEGITYIDYTCCSECDYWWPTHLAS